MGASYSYTPATVQIEKKDMSPVYHQIDTPWSRLGTYTFSSKDQYELTNALVSNGYSNADAEAVVFYIDKVIDQVKERHDLQEDISYVEFVSQRYKILFRLSFWDVKKDEARKKLSHTNILKLNIPVN